MSELPRVDSFEALGVHLWHTSQQLQALHEKVSHMATHDDIRGIKETIAMLATRQEVDDKVSALREEMNRQKPSALFTTVVRVAAGVVVLVAFGAMVIEVAESYSAMKRAAHVAPKG